jgi:putative DNA primase/helicase
MFEDGTGGVFGCYATGLEEVWQADRGRQWTLEEEAAHRARIEQARKERKAQEEKRQKEAREAARLIWADSYPVGSKSDHPYLERKCVNPYGARLIHADNARCDAQNLPDALSGLLLAIPGRDASGVLHSLQFVTETGDKRFLPGGRKQGCYHAIGQPSGVILVAEGYATAASLHEATGYAVACSFDAGNLRPVALSLREKFPDICIVLCADDDHRTDGNPGLTAARKAAAAVGGVVAVPDFGEARPEGATDFNDLHQSRGLEAVKHCIDAEPEGGAVEEINDSGWSKPQPLTAKIEPEPMPLPKLPPVPEFPLAALPDKLKAYADDAASRARFPVDFIAVSLMVALGSVIGRKIGIRVKQFDDWTEFPNVWGVAVGLPATLKSPAMRDGLRAIKALQVTADEKHNAEISRWNAEVEIAKLRRAASKKAAAKTLADDPDADVTIDGAEPEKPKGRVYWTSAPTPQKLEELLVDNPGGLLVERDELSAWLAMLDDDRNADARKLFLSGWSGRESFRTDTIGRGTISLPEYALSVLGGIQPGPLARYVRAAYSGDKADGLLQRFQLLVWPDAQVFKYVDRPPNKAAKEAMTALFKAADEFGPYLIGTDDEYGGRPYIRFSVEAQALFEEWYTDFMNEQRRANEVPALAAHFGKYPGLVGKLALITHVADNPESSEVSKRTLLKALTWIEYLISHARRVYHAVTSPETGAAELLLARLTRSELPEHFKAWEISRKCWHGLADREAVKKACRLLHEFGWLIELDAVGQTGGRPADPVYAVSPAVEIAL